MQQSRILNIFLASSITELKDERRDISNELSGDISSLLERDNYVVHFHKCENYHAGYDGTPIQLFLDQLLKDCDFSLFLFKTHLGERTEKEYYVARECQKTRKHVIFIYFLQTPEDTKEQKLKEFQANLDIDWEECKNIEDVEKKFLLGFLKRLGVKVDTSESDRFENSGESIFNKLVEAEEEKEALRARLRSIIDDVPSQIESIISSSTESNAAMIAQIKSLYFKADHWAMAINYEADAYRKLLSDYGEFIYKFGLYQKSKEIEDIYLRCIDFSKQLYGDDSTMTADAYHKIGRVYDCLKEYDQALNYHQSALKIRIRVSGRKDKRTADSYANIGIVFSEKNQNLTAIRFFYKALRARIRSREKDFRSISFDYNNLGWLFCIQDQYRIALVYLNKALEIVDSTDEIVTPYIYNNLGFAYMCINRNSEALHYLQKAIKIREKNLGVEHPDTVESYINIGFLHEKMKNNDLSLQYFKKALSIHPILIKPIHHIIRGSYNWNRLLSANGNEDAYSYLKRNWR